MNKKTIPTADEMLVEFRETQNAEAMVTLTETQQFAYEVFAGHVLNALAERREQTESGMVQRHDLNLRFKHLVKKGNYPGGFALALLRMQLHGYLTVRTLLGKQVVVDGPTNEAFEAYAKKTGDDSVLPLRRWIGVLHHLGTPADQKVIDRAMKR